MKVLNYFNLIMMMAMALFTWTAIAEAAEPMRIHVMQNLTPSEAKDINLALVKLGYLPTDKSLFTESKNAIIITKALKNEREPASLTVELVQLENEKDIPRTVFQYSISGNDVGEMVKALPKPEAFAEPSALNSVASTDAN
jgi:hypothetical protein